MARGDSTVQDLDSRYAASREQRRRHEGQWLVNLAYYLGYQWVAWDGGRLYEPELDPYQIKLVDNRIQPAVRVDVAKMTKSKPVFVGVPANSSDGAMAAARLTESSLDWQWDRLNCLRELRQALLWTRVCSAGFWKVCWDKTLGKEFQVVTDEHGQVMRDQHGAPLTPQRIGEVAPELAATVKTKRLAQGDIRLDTRSPFQIFPDPLAGEAGLDECDWIIEESVVSLDYARERFGYDGEATASTQDGFSGVVAVAGIGQKGGQQYRGVKIREYWAKSGSEHAGGRYCVWASGNDADGELLHEGDNPYPWLPYVGFRGTPVPGRFWPDALVTQLVSPQTELNKRKAQIAENAARLGNPPLLRPRGSDWEYSGLPGGEIVYDNTGSPSDVPTFLQPPEMPGYVREDIERTLSSIEDISGQHEVSKGNVPSGVTAASAINLLQEADDTRLGPDIADMERTIADAGKRIAWLMQHYYSDERMMRIAGDDGAWDIRPFRGKQLEGNDDVQVQAGSSMPRSKAARQAAIQQMLSLALQHGYPLKERNLRRVLQAMDVGGIERVFADLGGVERQVHREHMVLAQGEELTINDYDDDQAHVDGHQEWMRGAEYEELIQKNPEAGAQALAHLKAHQDRLARKAAAMAGAPPPGPETPTGGGPQAIPGGGLAGPQNGSGPAGGLPFSMTGQ